MLGQRAAQPVLGILDSKFGGAPYAEEADLRWEGFRFLGQLHFARIQDLPPELPRHGLFALDLKNRGPFSQAFRVRWYPAPSEARARSFPLPRSVGPWEARMSFESGWSLPGGRAWDAPLLAEDAELQEHWSDWDPDGFLMDELGAGVHRLGGHRSAVLDEQEDPLPPSGHTPYMQLWRINYDNPAGFHWGTNWVYVLIHPEDLAAGRLERAVVTSANA
ncbi:DUF1963 domain-containing protein [Corallococcus sp. bb12-1]|uniref:DUF1963 domain-containing protein n=1 Tax=Corallococcus sp. bb12-1 TaxID=2996784 RepID=UPI00226E308E|nr:DUF1963 domain-containing protein [Corallococcus sp. bb12-1]MCY1041598.1 DUF1963 domain-containing protein [Corallococcus sp. bb12-1]